MIRFASEDVQHGVRLRQEAASDLRLVSLKVFGCLCLAGEGKINIMSPNCLCVSRSPLSTSHVFFLPLIAVFRQLPLRSQINCSPAAFGNGELRRKHLALQVHSAFSYNREGTSI